MAWKVSVWRHFDDPGAAIIVSNNHFFEQGIETFHPPVSLLLLLLLLLLLRIAASFINGVCKSYEARRWIHPPLQDDPLGSTTQPRFHFMAFYGNFILPRFDIIRVIMRHPFSHGGCHRHSTNGRNRIEAHLIGSQFLRAGNAASDAVHHLRAVLNRASLAVMMMGLIRWRAPANPTIWPPSTTDGVGHSTPGKQLLVFIPLDSLFSSFSYLFEFDIQSGRKCDFIFFYFLGNCRK